jgi:hypothetical protein
MVNTLFIELLNLCANSSQKTPFEDFTTEILAGILQSDQELLDNFVNTILGITGNEFSVTTQVSYPNSKIDMVFENTTILCFLENKVEATEGYNQLRKYAEILLQEEAKAHIFLRYCTKYYDKKLPGEYTPFDSKYFSQFRWVDVYKFLHDNYQANPLVNAFLTFLEENNMSSIPEFTDGDLLAMKEISHTVKKIEACLEVIQPIFTKLFGRSSPVVDLKQYKRYGMRRTDIFAGSSAFSALSLAFSFEEEPTVFISCFCGKQHRMNSAYTKLVMSKEMPQELQWRKSKYGISAWFQKPLSDFIIYTNQFEEIRQWFIEKMNTWFEIMRANPQISWNLPEPIGDDVAN